MLSAAVRQNLTALPRGGSSPISGWIRFIDLTVVLTAVLTLLFLGGVYLLRKVGKKRLAFNWTRVFIAAFSIMLVEVYLYFPFSSLIYWGELSSGVIGISDPVMLALSYVVVWGLFWSVPSLIVAAISTLTYKFRMYVLKRVLAAGVVILAVGSLAQLYASAFIMHQWNYYLQPKNVFRLIPNWIASLYHPISTMIITIGVITITYAILYKPVKTHIPHLTQHI